MCKQLLLIRLIHPKPGVADVHGPLAGYWSKGANDKATEFGFKIELDPAKYPVDFWCFWCYHIGMKEKHRWPTTSIRANPEVLHRARVAAITQKKTLGQWLEEAIVEKIEKEQKLDNESQKRKQHFTPA